MMSKQEDFLPEQGSIPEIQVPVTLSLFEKLKSNWTIVIAVALGGTILIVSIAYLVYSYRHSSEQLQPTPVPTPTEISSQGKIAFVRDGDIWVINPDGSEEEKVLDLPNKEGSLIERDLPLKWTRSGESLFVPLLTPEGRQSLYVLSMIDKELTFIAAADEIFDYDGWYKRELGAGKAIDVAYYFAVSQFEDEKYEIAIFSGGWGRDEKGYAYGTSSGEPILLDKPAQTVEYDEQERKLFFLCTSDSQATIYFMGLRDDEKMELISTPSVDSFNLSPSGNKIIFSKFFFFQNDTKIVGTTGTIFIHELDTGKFIKKINFFKRDVVYGGNLEDRRRFENMAADNSFIAEEKSLLSSSGKYLALIFNLTGGADTQELWVVNLEDGTSFSPSQMQSKHAMDFSWFNEDTRLLIEPFTMSVPPEFVVWDFLSDSLITLVANASQPVWSPQ